jgi:septal ring factor EnvC (AmiA/AmiB activator)
MPRSQVLAVEQLTDLVRALDITGLDPAGVRQLLVAADQLANAAEALAARAMVQMHREARADDAGSPGAADRPAPNAVGSTSTTPSLPRPAPPPLRISPVCVATTIGSSTPQAGS